MLIILKNGMFFFYLYICLRLSYIYHPLIFISLILIFFFSESIKLILMKHRKHRRYFRSPPIIFDDESPSDVVLVVGKQEFFVHREVSLFIIIIKFRYH